jgi:hypothetical protein
VGRRARAAVRSGAGAGHGGGRARAHAGRLSGVVERVRTGEKVRFHGLETLSRAVASLLSTGAEGS